MKDRRQSLIQDLHEILSHEGYDYSTWTEEDILIWAQYSGYIKGGKDGRGKHDNLCTVSDEHNLCVQQVQEPDNIRNN